MKAEKALLPGLTLITGSNECGKSVFMEMILFALFGSECLRGPKSDYAEVKATLTTSLFKVVRTLSTAEVFVGGVLKASGQTGASKCITGLLGFGVNTFLITCAVRQGEVEALGKMRPAARKAMIEDALGINSLNVCEKHVKKQLSELKVSIAAVERLVAVVPDKVDIEPDKLHNLQTKLAELIEIRNKSQQASHTIQHLSQIVDSFRGYPVAPQGDVEELREELEAAMEVEEQIRTIRHTLQFLTKSELNYSEEETLKLLNDWSVVEHWKNAPVHPDAAKRLLLEQEWYELSQKIQSNIECPSCGVEFTPSGEIQTKTLLRLDELSEYRCEKLTMQHKTVDLQGSQDFWGDLEYPPMVLTPPHSKAALQLHLNAIPSQQNIAELENRLQLLLPMQSDTTALKARLKEFQDYSQLMDVAHAKAEAVEKAKAEIAILRYDQCDSEVYDEINNLSVEIKQVEEHLRENEKRAALIESNASLEVQIGEYQTQSAEYSTCLTAINTVRELIKTSLAPELSTRSSIYMSQLTGTARAVVVDSDMDVKVDGVGLHALSGSAKACADLSLRFALAGAMTQKVFPVLLCDEPDAAFDESRAEQITKLLETISKQGQVIMISHKETSADQVILL